MANLLARATVYMPIEADTELPVTRYEDDGIPVEVPDERVEEFLATDNFERAPEAEEED